MCPGTRQRVRPAELVLSSSHPQVPNARDDSEVVYQGAAISRVIFALGSRGWLAEPERQGQRSRRGSRSTAAVTAALPVMAGKDFYLTFELKSLRYKNIYSMECIFIHYE